MVLSAQQVQEFHDNGVVLAENVVTDGDLQPVIDELRAWIDHRARQLHSEGKIKQLHEDKPFENRLYYLAEQYPQFNEGLDIINIRGRGMFEFLLNDHLLDAVEQLLGTPEITCNPIQHIRSKMYNPQQSGGSTGNFPDVPWHQDAGVTWDEADESLILTCWIAMTDATRENGCMEVIPGVARGGYLDHTPDGGTQIRSELLPDRAPICAEVNKGGAVFMSQFTPDRKSVV